MATKLSIKKELAVKIRELNETGYLQTELRLGAVARPLCDLTQAAGVEVALEVLDQVLAEGNDAALADPTNFVKNAAQEWAAIHQVKEEVKEEPQDEWDGEAQEEQAGDADDDQLEDDDGIEVNLDHRVKTKVEQLNKTGKLVEPLDLNKIGRALARLGPGAATCLLKDVEDNADMVDKPNILVMDAASKIFSSGRGGMEGKEVKDFRSLMMKIRKINENVPMKFPLHMGNVLEILQPATFQQSFDVLKAFVAEVDDAGEAPQQWLRNKVWELTGVWKSKEKGKGKGKDKGKNKGMDKGAGKGKESRAGKGKENGAGKGQAKGIAKGSKPGNGITQGGKNAAKGAAGKDGTKGRPLTASEKKVARQVALISTQSGLQLDYRRLKSSLDKVDEAQQLSILSQLQEKSDTIEKPEAWIAGACKKLADREEEPANNRRTQASGKAAGKATGKAKGKAKGQAKGKEPAAKRQRLATPKEEPEAEAMEEEEGEVKEELEESAGAEEEDMGDDMEEFPLPDE
mmetsp:Transcript_22266/g.40113  ORF Transcript_22266/g.40113 Transcript_22266/m.40113 type:complete len:516 (-) Transcript_22266:84-1631(-)|eukprot:CAMPEP_0197640952 /NCGR_PEP_ID=MMETSP1338-20131121/15062_1 /TAXON_ID=43686 ORGANISM="Pelagodinium beii, Strain RCC1491" /NCGR_SAMPLE_ID=MMETSP1338 /ASSEMBLY_ACC=CAM_ASM_000754 /LENGTH=515 /DNA_ID=CAMNT_0043213845 /DNA_START=54 /DNA_END=1601 /DNA_ORIENTATION=-